MKISSPTNMHFVPPYKMKNKSSKRLTLKEGALKSFEPSILYWNSFCSIPDSRSTIWVPVQIKCSDLVRLPIPLEDNSY